MIPGRLHPNQGADQGGVNAVALRLAVNVFFNACQGRPPTLHEAHPCRDTPAGHGDAEFFVRNVHEDAPTLLVGVGDNLSPSRECRRTEGHRQDHACYQQMHSSL